MHPRSQYDWLLCGSDHSYQPDESMVFDYRYGRMTYKFTIVANDSEISGTAFYADGSSETTTVRDTSSFEKIKSFQFGLGTTSSTDGPTYNMFVDDVNWTGN
jgi:hypothetical protein